MTPRHARSIVALAAGAFIAYWGLLVYCEVWKPVASGLTLSFRDSPPIIASVARDSPASRAGLQSGDRLISIAGFPMGDRLDVAAVMANFDIDRPLAIAVERTGAASFHTMTLPIITWSSWRRFDGPAILSIRLVQLVVLLLALVVALRRPLDPVALVGAGFLATMGVFSLAMPYRFATVWRELPTIVAVALAVPAISSVVIGGWLLSFFSVVPRVRVRSPLIWIAIWLPAAPGVVSCAAYLIDVVARARPGLNPRLWPIALLGVNSAYLVAGLCVLIAGYRGAADINERRRIRMLMTGSLIGCFAGAPVVWAYLRGSTVDLNRSFLASPFAIAGALLFLAMPLSFAYAILWQRLFDLSLMIRQGVRYALARHAVIGLVPVLVIVLAVDLLAHSDQSVAVVLHSRLWQYTLVLGIALVARSQHGRWLDAIDRRFFRERYQAERLLREIAGDIRQPAHLATIAPAVVSRVEQALHPAFAALMVRGASVRGYRTLAASPRSAAPDVLDDENKVVALVRLLGTSIDIADPSSGWLTQRVPAADVATLRAAAVDLLVPVSSGQGAADALLVLGPKRSDEPYSDDDLSLLAAIAERLSHCLPSEPADRDHFEECPVCGSCYEASTAQCVTDGAALIDVPRPRMFGGRYRTDRRLGQGGMGTVYAAYDTALMRPVAVKMLRPDVLGIPGAAERFQREARAAAAFSHPNVVTVHDFGVDGGHAFLVMELLDGCTLHAALSEDAVLEPRRALDILRDVAAAVDAAHARQLIHRDLKPENIYLVAGREAAKVLDFGIAKFLSLDDGGVAASPETTNVGLIGTPRYMAPEQLRGENPSVSWDVWAMTVVAHEMLTGVHPFASIGLRLGDRDGAEVVGAGRLNESCRGYFARALALDPADRPPTAGALYAELER